MAEDQDIIYLDNVWVIQDTLTNALDGSAATGLTVEGFFTEDRDSDAPIHADLRVNMTDGDGLGVYTSAPIDEETLALHLAGLASVYEIVRTTDGDYRTWKRRKIKASRPAE